MVTAIFSDEKFRLFFEKRMMGQYTRAFWLAVVALFRSLRVTSPVTGFLNGGRVLTSALARFLQLLAQKP